MSSDDARTVKLGTSVKSRQQEGESNTDEVQDEPLGKPRATITELRYRHAAGGVLTEEERLQVREYYRKYTPNKTSIHVRLARLEAWRTAAKAQGISLSHWIVDRVEESLTGYDDAVADVRAEADSLRGELATLRGLNGNLAVENSKLQQRIEAMEPALREVLQTLLNRKEPGAP